MNAELSVAAPKSNMICLLCAVCNVRDLIELVNRPLVFSKRHIFLGYYLLLKHPSKFLSFFLK